MPSLARSFNFKKDPFNRIAMEDLIEFYNKTKEECAQNKINKDIYRKMLNQLDYIIKKKGIELKVFDTMLYFDKYPKVNELFLLKLNSDNSDMIKSFIDDYLEYFINDDLNPKDNDEYCGFNKNLKEVSNLIETYFNKYEKKEFWISSTIETKEGFGFLDKEIRFYESLLFLKEHQCIEFSDSEFKLININLYQHLTKILFFIITLIFV